MRRVKFRIAAFSAAASVGLALAGVGQTQPGQSWTFNLQTPEANEPATPCAPEGSLWRDLAAYEPRPAVDAPRLRLALDRSAGRIWSASVTKATEPSDAETRAADPPEVTSLEEPDPSPFAVADKTALFAASGLSIPAGDYIGVLLPPGGNSSLLIESLPEDGGPSPTGRAGAVFLLPDGDRAAFCAAHGVGGYVIHSGAADDIETLGRIPSLVMAEDDLAQLAANLIARGGVARPLLGRPYEEVGPANAGAEGFRGLRAFAVHVDRTDIASGAPGPAAPVSLPELMSYADLMSIRRQVAEGWRHIFADMSNLYDAHMQTAGALYQLQFDPDPAVRRQAILDSNANAAVLKGKLTAHIAALQAARDAGEIPANQVTPAEVEQEIARARSMIAMTESFEYDYADALAMLERLTPEGRLDPEAEFDLESVDTGFMNCVLEPHFRTLAPFHEDLMGHRVDLKGRAALFFTRDPLLPNAFRTHLKILVNVNDLVRAQEQAVRRALPEDGCDIRTSVRDSRMYPDAAGRMNGRVTVRARLGVCYSYKYPCWKRWKTYMCRANQWAQIGSRTDELAVSIASRELADAFELRLTGVINGAVRLEPGRWAGFGPELQQAASTLNVRPRHSFFSEDGTNLWYVVELSGEGKLPSAPCAFQDVLRQHGGF